MTGILQPLDVGVNRSFQKFYDDKYETYLDLALAAPKSSLYYTKQGNIKIPSYNMVADWCTDFAKQFEKELVTKAFRVCGIGYDNADLYHDKLKKLLDGSMDGSKLTDEDTEYLDDGIEFEFDFSQDGVVQLESFFEALALLAGNNEEAESVLGQIIVEMKGNENLIDILDDDYITALSTEDESTLFGIGQNEIYAFCCSYKRSLVLYDGMERKVLRFGKKEDKECILALDNSYWYAKTR